MKRETVQNGNCFGLFGTRALRALWILDFVDIGFLHLDTGPIVQGLVCVENELVLKRFVARNIRAFSHLSGICVLGQVCFQRWNKKLRMLLCQMVLNHLGGG